MADRELDELTEWIRGIVGGRPVTMERAVVRREGWIVSAGDDRWFLRLGRDADPANPPGGVVAEGRVIAALGGEGLAVPGVVGIHERGAVLYEWLPGTADVDHEPADLQQAELDGYVDQLAALHTLDLGNLDLDWMSRPADARTCALAHAEAVWDQMGAMALEPLSTFGINWLRWHAPDTVGRLSLLHGDAGVGNFLVDAGRVRGVIDWEWAHIGDPMEDLGSVAMHASFHPVGDLRTAFTRYQERSGIEVDHAKVRFYAAHLYVRSVIALSAHVAHLDPHNPVALNLAYKIVNDRLTCEAIADALGVQLDAPALPAEPDESPVTLFDVVVANLTDDVSPATTGELARDRVEKAARLVGVLARRAQWADAIASIECAELSTLLDRPVTDLDGGLRALDAHITKRGSDCEVEVLGYLYRRAVRAEWLAEPVSRLFPDRTIAAI